MMIYMYECTFRGNIQNLSIHVVINHNKMLVKYFISTFS